LEPLELVEVDTQAVEGLEKEWAQEYQPQPTQEAPKRELTAKEKEEQEKKEEKLAQD
jgi:hypothetical protein